MREFSKIYHNVWTSQKFERLPNSDAKLLYLYVLSSQHSNSSGCYNLKPGYALADLNWSEIAYREAIDSLSKVGLIATDEATVLVVKWVDFNPPTNAKHAISVFAQLDAAASQRLKHKRGQELTVVIDRKRYTNDRVCGPWLDSLCKPYRDSLSNPEIDRIQAPRPRPRPDLDQVSRAREPTPRHAAQPLKAAAVAPIEDDPPNDTLKTKPQQPSEELKAMLRAKSRNDL